MGTRHSTAIQGDIRPRSATTMYRFFRHNTVTVSEESRTLSKVSTHSSPVQWMHEKKGQIKNLSLAAALREKFQEQLAMVSKQIMATSGKETIEGFTKKQMIEIWAGTLGADVDTDFADKLFKLMDCDGNGIIDETEFTVVMSFIMSSPNTTLEENAELAYELFDVNKDGELSQQEFSEMLAAVIGSSLEQLVKEKGVAEEFEKFLVSQCCEESLHFYYDLKQYIKYRGIKRQFDDMTLSYAKEINATYIVEGSVKSINIPHEMQQKILESVQRAEDAGDETISGEIYSLAIGEIIYLLESGPIARFKDVVKDKPYSSLTINAWKEAGLESNEAMSKEQFYQWSLGKSHIFDFLVELRTMFNKHFNKQLKRLSRRLSKDGSFILASS